MTKKLALLDKLNHRRKCGFIQCTENWQGIRMTRNKFAKNAVLINLVSAAATEMHQLLLGIQAKFGHAYPSLELGILIGNCNAFANV